MLQIKVFYLFILAAAPAATLPLPTLSKEHQEVMDDFYLRHPEQAAQDPLAPFLYGGGGTLQ